VRRARRESRCDTRQKLTMRDGVVEPDEQRAKCAGTGGNVRLGDGVAETERSLCFTVEW
jgi:hypothetical protein